jgi:hypothetical protein
MRDDVKIIMSGGVSVERIYLFSTRDVPIAKRHVLQEWARTTYGVSLEIIDGEAVAELLSATDTFWIAERYLELPVELLPTLPATEAHDWYTRVLAKWRRATWSAQTFADLTEIRTAARTALGPFAYTEDGHPIHRHERPELPFWIERLDEFAEQTALDALRRRALYEATVLRLRGLGTLIGQEERLRQYFAAIPQLEKVADLEDTEALLAYLLPASRLGFVHLTGPELQAWHGALASRLDERLVDAEKHARKNARCALLEVRGHLALLRRFEQGKMDIEGTLSYWNQLAHLAKEAPLFPLERFADRLTEYARYFGAHPAYEPLTRIVDALLTERFGGFKVAEQCLGRARAFRKAGDLPRAMAQLHRAKVDWFAEETLGKSLFALNWLSEAYKEQGLFFAAKYYALAAAYLALQTEDPHLKPIVARSLESAAACDYGTGAWHGFLELAEVCLTCHWQFAPEPDADLDNPAGLLQRLLFHLSLLLLTTKRLYPGGEPFARERCTRLVEQVGLGDVLEEGQALAEKAWADKNPSELWKAIEEQLAGAPWSDAGAVRQAGWKAHGVTWRARWTNDYETTLAAEEFLAALQVVLSDLAGEDLCLMSSTLHFSIRLAADDGRSRESGYKGFDIDFEHSNEERYAQVTLPPYRHFRDGLLTYEDLQVGALTITSQLLAEVSLLPTQQFQRLLQDRFAHGLTSKLHIGASYARCLCTFVSRVEFEASARNTRTELTAPSPFISHFPLVLPWCGGPGPGYDPENARAALENRYRRFARPIARTVKRLAREPAFQATLAQLRAEGWKDWHLLSTVFHVTVNYRLNQRRIILSPAAEEEATRRLLSQPEPEDAPPVPVAEYATEKLRQQLKMYMASFAHTFGLELHQLAPDLPALEDFLAHRYHFWSDDVAHEDPFLVS